MAKQGALKTCFWRANWRFSIIFLEWETSCRQARKNNQSKSSKQKRLAGGGHTYPLPKTGVASHFGEGPKRATKRARSCFAPSKSGKWFLSGTTGSFFLNRSRYTHQRHGRSYKAHGQISDFLLQYMLPQTTVYSSFSSHFDTCTFQAPKPTASAHPKALRSLPLVSSFLVAEFHRHV